MNAQRCEPDSEGHETLAPRPSGAKGKGELPASRLGPFHRLRSTLPALASLPIWLVLACQSPLPFVATEDRVDGPELASLDGWKGYRSRPCGFDLDDDGIAGEAEDCRICDGRTTDPDGDGVDEDLIYVDCQAGNDSAACGSPERPCATVEHAWTVRADGPGDGAEDVICFTGRCRPHLLTPAVAGVPGVRAETPAENRPLGFEFPTDPTLLVGWDVDGDGAYPPYDTDDLSVLDGGSLEGESEGLSRAFVLGSGNSRLEMAHFSVVDYGRDTAVERSGFVHFFERGGLRADHLYFHDLSLRNINRERPAQGHRIVFNYFTGGTNFHHLAFVNLEISNTSGFMVRGSGPDRPGSEAEGGNDGPFRWQNLSVTADGCNHSDVACREGGGAAFIGWKLWGWIDGIEVSSSVFDAQVEAWEPKPEGNGGALLINATQCSRGWRVFGNTVRDFKVGFRAQGGDGAYCSHGDETLDGRAEQVPRPTGDVVFDRNTFWNTYGPWRKGDYLVHLKGGKGLHRTLDDVTISQNVLASSDGYDACILVEVGHGGDPHEGPQPGLVDIYANTCWGARADGRSTGIEISASRLTRAFPQHRIRLRNNLVVGAKKGDYGLRLRYVPELLRTSGNVFSPEARFAIAKRRFASVAELDLALGTDSRSVECEPIFVDPGNGDFHLAAEDDCAAGVGANLSFWARQDSDGDPRPEGGPWDAGADQRRADPEL